MFISRRKDPYFALSHGKASQGKRTRGTELLVPPKLDPKGERRGRRKDPYFALSHGKASQGKRTRGTELLVPPKLDPKGERGGRRKERVTELIRKEVAGIISREIEISGAIITFTRIEVSVDIQSANIYFLTIPDDRAEEVHKKLKKNIFSIQQALNKRLRMRPVPRIRFLIDKQEQEASKIDEILTRI